MKREINEKKSIAWAVSSLITSILGTLLFLAPYFGLPLSVFSIIAYAVQQKFGGNGMATAGLVIGIIGTLMNLASTLILIVALMMVS